MAQMVTLSHRLRSKIVDRAAGGRGGFNIGGKVPSLRDAATDIFQLPIFIVDITRNDGYAKKMEFTFASVIN